MAAAAPSSGFPWTAIAIVGGLGVVAVGVFLFLRMRKEEKEEEAAATPFLETPRAPAKPRREQGGITAGATIGTVDTQNQVRDQLRDAGASIAELSLGI